MTNHAGLPESTMASPNRNSTRPLSWPTLREWAALLLIVLLGVGLRTLYLREVIHTPGFDTQNKEAALYQDWTKGLLTGDWTPSGGTPDPHLAEAPFFRPPGYPYFLAGLYSVFGNTPLAARITQMVLGLLSCVLLFFLARGAFGRAAGLAGALFMAVYWGLIYAGAELTPSALIVFLLLVLLALLRYWISSPGIMRALFPGFVLGAMALLRPEMLVLLPLIALWGVGTAAGRRFRALVSLVALLLGTALVIAPVTLRNYQVSKEVVPIAAMGGLELYAANNPEADGIYPKINMKEALDLDAPLEVNGLPLYLDALKKKLGNDALTYNGLSHYFAAQAWRYMVDHPKQTLERMGKKALVFWGPAEVPNTCVPDYRKANSKLLRFMPGFEGVAALCLLGLGWVLAGAVRKSGWMREYPVVLLTVGMLVFLFLAYLPFFPAAQFRLGMLPLMLLLGAGAVQGLAHLAVSRQPVRLAGAAAAGLVLFFVLRVDWAGPPRDMAALHYDRGVAYEREGKLPEAAEEYQKSLDAGYQPNARSALGWLKAQEGKFDEAENLFAEELKQNPDNLQAEFNWGRTLGLQGKYKEALDHLQEAVNKAPGYAEAHNGMGHVFMRMEDDRSAIKKFREACRLAPQNGVYLVNLAEALMYSGDFEEARQRFAEAVQREPDNGQIENAWGNALAGQGRMEEALPRFQEAVRKDPSIAEAQNSLGYLLAQQGRIDEAIPHYTEALRLNPRFTLAMNNLGNVLTDQGKYEEAIPYFQKALEINREDLHAEFNWGRALSLKGDSAAAIEHFQEAIRKRPDYASAHNFLGWDLYRLGRMEEAETAFKDAIRLAPNFILPRNNLGQLFLDTGRYEEARVQFEAALQINANDPFPAERLKIIREKQAAPAPLQP